MARNRCESGDPVWGATGHVKASRRCCRLPGGAGCVLIVATLALLLAGPTVCATPVAQPDATGASAPPEAASSREAAAGRVKLAPGVLVDWVEQAVELEAAVVLRRGPLELLACSVGTREHESILVTRARPLHMFQALGLIGLEPGKPVRFDEQNDRWLPPTGPRLRIDIRYLQDGRRVEIPAEQWLWDVGREAPAEPLNWVFAGSMQLEGGRFGADIDGTVICVVDFATALITVSDLHTADNDQLWLSARTDAIPPIDTLCTLVIHPRDAGPRLVVRVGREGGLHIKGKKLTAEDVATRWRKMDDSRREGTSHAVVVLLAAKDTPAAKMKGAKADLHKSGVPEASVQAIGGTRSESDRAKKPTESPPIKTERPTENAPAAPAESSPPAGEAPPPTPASPKEQVPSSTQPPRPNELRPHRRSIAPRDPGE
jgi:hypothetical protein